MRQLLILCFLILAQKGFSQTKDTVLYYDTGEKQAEGKIREGLKQGRWTFYYRSGNKKSTQFFQKGVVGGAEYTYSGKEYAWFPTGVLKEEFNWSEGKIHGVQKLYFANGGVKKELVSEKGLYYSSVKDYYGDSNNTLKSVIRYEWYTEDLDENISIKIPANLIETAEDNQLLHPTLKKSSWKYYYPSGKLRTEGVYEKGDYKTGDQERLVEYVYADNETKQLYSLYKKETISRYHYSGLEFLYYEDSTVKEERRWLNGKVEGTIKQYYPGGSLKKEIPCANGLFHGIVKEYYESGQLYSEAFLVNGRDTSAKNVYHPNGQLRQKGPMKDGCYLLYDTLGKRIFPKYRNVVDDKPVIYLYPEKETNVKVSLEYNGKFLFTYPEYKKGWNVKAFPDGKIINEEDQQEFSYLFWEGENYNDYLSTIDFSKGVVVSGDETQAFLRKSLAAMGLVPKEYNEFLVYWLPKMIQNKYNYIYFMTGKEYDKVAGINVSPKPDAVLRIFMVFQPMEYAMEVHPQVITPFERKGFTLVEWGGTQTNNLGLGF